MDLTQMHVMFRQFAQQMGMQNVRAILPEQIDLLINTSISDSVNRIIQTNIGVTNDRVVTDNSKVGQVNSLRTLYKATNVEASNFTSTVINKYSTKLSCNIDEIVLDPFMGSGTTAIAARQLSRKYIGFEISQEYVDLANKRLQETKTLFD